MFDAYKRTEINPNAHMLVDCGGKYEHLLEAIKTKDLETNTRLFAE